MALLPLDKVGPVLCYFEINSIELGCASRTSCCFQALFSASGFTKFKTASLASEDSICYESALLFWDQVFRNHDFLFDEPMNNRCFENQINAIAIISHNHQS
jgi:hypothetical protein